MESNGTLDMSKIDQNIKEAQAKADKQEGAGTSEGTKGRKRLTDEERAERNAKRDAEKAQRKAEREALKAAKAAAKGSNEPPAHLKKVEKALERLPEMSDLVRASFETVLSSELDLADIEVLVAHLEGHVRLERTRSALSRDLKVGQAVRIVGGDQRFVGSTGTVEKSQRIRCYVNIPGVNKSVYLFTSDVEVLQGGEEVSVEQDEAQVEEHVKDELEAEAI